MLVLMYFPFFHLNSEKRKMKFSQQLFLVLCLFSGIAAVWLPIEAFGDLEEHVF